jgi:hypothetical protein
MCEHVDLGDGVGASSFTRYYMPGVSGQPEVSLVRFIAAAYLSIPYYLLLCIV